MLNALPHAPLKLRHLEIFREVLRAGSTRAAAAKLGISQPAVSQQVKQLEISLGIDLFQRSANRMTPLREAWELLRSVEETLSSFERLEASIGEIRNQENVPLSIAASSVFGFVALPAVAKALLERNGPGLRTLSGSDEQVKMHVLSGRADFGIARLPLDPGLFDLLPLATATNVCMFHHEHRFAGFPCVTAEDLVGEAIVDIDLRFASHQMNLDALRFRGFEPSLVVEYDDTGHEVGFVASRLGVAITNAVIARQYSAFKIGTKPFTPSALYHYVAVWQKGRRLSDRMETLLKALTDAFAIPANSMAP